ncbi:protein translocase subunit SecD [Candidatus Peregrinibacteria bacterium CG10_big_fil_rev_8_21_14_0_10_55_24]|nr:MAG: protein translocase subunit SecD [Candidatus Peregrinibacteria bacterium CG10_big_fil_rev_8_21_14_0_10_55_24]
MHARRPYAWPILTVVVAAIVIIVALPQHMRQWAPGILGGAQLHYGLDLVGGTQLDFRISEQEMRDQAQRLKEELAALENQNGSVEDMNLLQAQLIAIEDQQRGIVEAIRTVLERRINSLGVSEAVITPSYVGEEKHLLVECPGIVETQDCINIVGKTIQLEFKEEFTEPTEEFEQSVHDRVRSIQRRMTQSGDTLAVIGEDMSDDLGVYYIDAHPFFKDQLPEGLDTLWNLTPKTGVREVEGTLQIPSRGDDGQVYAQDIPGIYLAEITQTRTETGRILEDQAMALEYLASSDRTLSLKTQENTQLTDAQDELTQALREMAPNDVRTVTTPQGTMVVILRSRTLGTEQVEASHILISYKGALSSDESVTRTKEEALSLAQELKERIDGGEDYVNLARAYSDGPSGEEGGTLGTFGRGTMVPAFEDVAFALPSGSVSDPVETQFGYHIIRVEQGVQRSPDTVSYDTLTVSGDDAISRAATIAEQVKSGSVERQEEFTTIRAIFFSLLPTGWKDTTLDGKHFRSATVTLDPTTNLPLVQITFDAEGARLFQELTKMNVGKRIAIFVGGELVSAPTVQTEIAGGIAVITGSQNFEEAKTLATDLNTGAIPAPIYLAGQHTVEATLGAQALENSLKAALIGIVVLMLYMVLIYRLLGVFANLALLVYAALFFAVLKLPLFLFSSQYIVLTLAGMAGIILSIGMAVDANVLIFERIKEELRKGKLFKTAVETGFLRAWPSIRDGNVSTVITCVILFAVGTSVVRGFAVTLGMGVVISMFSAIVVTHWFLRRIAKTPLAEKTSLFGVRRMNTP